MGPRPSLLRLTSMVFAVLLSCAAPRSVERPPVEAAHVPPAVEHTGPTPSPVPKPDVDFVVKREPRGDTEAIVVEVRFPGDTSGRTEVALPSEWGGQKELWRELSGIAPIGEGVTLSPGSSEKMRILSHAPGAEVGLRYEFEGTPDLESIGDGRNYRPIVQKRYFHFIGHALFAVPKAADDRQEPIAIHWRGLGPADHVADSFGVDERDQSFMATLSELEHAVYVGGDFRIRRTEVRGKPIFVAMRGTWGFSDDDFVGLVTKAVDIERAFFGDDDFDRFLVTLIPTGKGCCSYGGTGLTNSFATFIASDLPVEGRLEHLLTHELFHTWNGRRIQRQEPEELVYWFSEGFTDYYANLLSFRAGLQTFPEYVAQYDSILRQYYLSSARNAPNEAVKNAFWSDRAIERLPYQKGDILAHEWSLRIREATTEKSGRKPASFDDVMRDLFHAAMTQHAVVSASEIDTLVRPYLADGVAHDIVKYVDRGETLVPSARALGPCARLVHTSLGPFELGFDEKATDEAGALAGVVKNGPAWRAGARDGMKLRHSKWSSDPTHPVELTVVKGDDKRVIKYLPQGKAIQVPQYELDERRYERDREGCEAALR